MKKVYMNPATVIVKIETQQMIASSPTNVDLSEERQNPGGAASRQGRGYWDDEDEY